MINIEKRDKIDIITFSVDKINALMTDKIREEIGNLFGNGNSRVIINLKGVQYIDSSGFGCLLSILRTARNHYSILKFTNPEPSVMQVLETLNLHTVFDIYNDIDACVRSMR
jgi:anti-sigma B factor antagonist